MGIPSRIVTGFWGGTKSPFDNYLLIQGNNAHAWVEIWQDDKGWVKKDPTSLIAPQRLLINPSELFSSLDRYGSPLMKELIERTWISKNLQYIGLAWDFIYFRIDYFFTNYDFDAQKDIFGWPKRDSLRIIFLLFLTIFLPYLYYRKINKFIVFIARNKSQRVDQIYKSYLKRMNLTVYAGDTPLKTKLKAMKLYSDRQGDISLIFDLYQKLKYDPEIDQNLLKEFKRLCSSRAKKSVFDKCTYLKG